MKKLSLILNVILFIAVAGSYVLYFTGNKNVENSTPVQGEISSAASISGAKIAYVNFDSLLINYNYYNDLKNQLFEKKSKLEGELGSKSKSLEKEFSTFQDKVKKGLVTRYQAADMQKELQQKEQGLRQLGQQYEYQLMEEEQVMNRKIQYSILEYLKKFNKDKGFNYVFSNTFGGPFLFSDSTLNITNQVIKGINIEYEKNKK